MTEGLSLFGADRFGANTIAGFGAVITSRRIRRWATGQKKFFHRPRNGAHDPLTQFHVLMTLLEMKPNERFTARELTRHLQTHNDYFSWDPVTVGRIVMDFIGSIEAAYGTDTRWRPIVSSRHWAGNRYYVTDLVEGREILARLADDLYDACEKVVDAETAGSRVSRLASPLGELPSLTAAQLD